MNFTFCIDLKYLVWLLNVRSQGSGLPSVIGNLINPKIQPAKDCVVYIISHLQSLNSLPLLYLSVF